MRPAASTAIVSAAMLLAGCIVGFFVGRWTEATASAIRQAKSAAAIANLRQSIEDEVNGLRGEIRAAGVSSEVREPASRTPGDLDRHVAAVEEPNGSIETGALGTSPSRKMNAAGEVRVETRVFNVLTNWYDNGDIHILGDKVHVSASKTATGIHIEVKTGGLGPDCAFDVVGSLEDDPPVIHASSDWADDRSGEGAE